MTLDIHTRASLSEAIGCAVEGLGPDASLYEDKRYREVCAKRAVEVVMDAMASTVGDIVAAKLATLQCDEETRDMIENTARLHAFDMMTRVDDLPTPWQWR